MVCKVTAWARSMPAPAFRVTAHATLVTGPWTQSAGTAAMSDINTASPIWGNGSANNANASSIWSSFQLYTLAVPGDKIVLTGTAQLIGTIGGGENLRFGLFNVNSSANTSGWLGYFLRNGCGTTQASVMERANPNTGTFTSTTGAANVGTASIPGSPAFGDGLFNFSISIERNALDGLNIVTSLLRASDSIEFAPVTLVDTSPQTFSFDRVAYQATSGLAADQILLTNVDVTFTSVPEPTSALLGGFGALALLVRRRR